MEFIKICTGLIFVSMLTYSCQKDQNSLEDIEYTLEEQAIISARLNLPLVPDSYSVGNLEQGKEMDFKGTLGRVLFYDSKLSADGKISCASCHQQSRAFADNKAFSNGVNNNLTSRNSIALGSLRSFGAHYGELQNGGNGGPGLFWDERASSIKEQLRQTINNPNEMGVTLDEITAKVNQDEYYQILSNKAFGTNQLNEDHVLEALEVFLNSINSKNSIFETEVLGELNYITGDSIVGQSKFARGFELFTNNCSSCHGHNLSLGLDDNNQTGKLFIANNGLTLSNNDQGVFEFTNNQEDIGKFKIPGLRNIALTAPYMHDGRFETLEEVIDFYNSGINASQNLHPNLMENNLPKNMNFSDADKQDLIAFLTALTDEHLVSEMKWSDPFK